MNYQRSKCVFPVDLGNNVRPTDQPTDMRARIYTQSAQILIDKIMSDNQFTFSVALTDMTTQLLFFNATPACVRVCDYLIFPLFDDKVLTMFLPKQRMSKNAESLFIKYLGI